MFPSTSESQSFPKNSSRNALLLCTRKGPSAAEHINPPCSLSNACCPYTIFHNPVSKSLQLYTAIYLFLTRGLLTMHLPPLERLDVPYVAMGSATYLMSRPFTTKPSTVNLDGLQELVQRALPRKRLRIAQVEPVPGRHLNQLYKLRLLDGSSLILKGRPLPFIRLLRHEHDQLERDAHLSQVLSARTSVPVPAVLHLDKDAFIPAFGLASGILLMSYVDGWSLATASKSLKASARSRVDRIIGAHIKSLTDMRGSAFGPASAVLEQAASETFVSWKAFFTSMVEAALCDAEDMLVSIPYSDIRSLLQAHSWSLDEVNSPRLVPVEAGLPTNVLIDKEGETVVAMLGLGNAVFGDPLLAPVFNNPSEAFWEGFGRRRSYTRGENTRMTL